MIYKGFNKACFMACLCVLSTQSVAMDLNEVISSLYGGDGVTLEDNPFFSHRADFTNDSLDQLEMLSETISSITQPSISSVSVLTYEFDPVLDEFVPSTAPQSLGPPMTESPKTGGKGVLSFGLAFSHTKFTKLDGQDLSDLYVDLSHRELEPGRLTCLAPGFPNPPPSNCYRFIDDVVRLNLDLKIKNQFIWFSTNYGLSENLDIGFHIPLLHTQLSISSEASIINDPSIVYSPFGSVHAFDPVNEDPPDSSASGSHTGFGDLVLQLKHSFHHGDRLDLASFYQLRLPTGDTDNLQGIHGVGGSLMLLSSATYPLQRGALIPYFNFGIEINGSNNGQEEFIFDLGLEYDMFVGSKLFSAYIDLIGSNTISNKMGSGDNKYDLGLGIKYAVSNRGVVFANLIFPINDSGLRPNLTYIVGLTWTR